MKAFKVIPEFKMLRLTFHRKTASKSELGHISFFDLFSVYLKASDHLNLNLYASFSFKIRIFKVQDFANLNFPPCIIVL